MSFWTELLLWVRYHVGGGLKEAEDPRQALDAAYARKLEQQARVRRAVADVVTARKRLELQARQAQPAADREDARARTAIQQGRRDVARAAVAQRTMLREQLDELTRQIAALKAQEDRWAEVARELDIEVRRFRIQRESLSAAFTAAQARARLGEAVAESRLEGTDLDSALREARRSVAETEARARALEGLLAQGAVGAPPAPQLPPPSNVDAELARLEEEELWGKKGGPPPAP